MSSSANLRRALSKRSRSRICACTVTSSAVVGSSAMSRSGSPARAMAIIARCRMPPDNWWGYARAASEGSGIATSSSNAIARSSASRPRARPCTARTSAICVPTVCTGSSAVIGSWKTNPIRRPRTPHHSSSDRPTRSRPSSSTAPPVVRPGAGTRPMTPNAVSDLPLPDSPTRPSVSPRWMSNDTPRTACSQPAPRGNATSSPRTARRGGWGRAVSEGKVVVTRVAGLPAGFYAESAHCAVGRPTSLTPRITAA